MSNGPEITPLASPPTSEPWVPLWPLQPSALGELAYAQITAPVSVPISANEAGAVTVIAAPTITVDGNTPIVVEFFAPSAATAPNGFMEMMLYDGSTLISYLGELGAGNTGYALSNSAHLAQRLTPTAGSHTYSIKAYCLVAGPGNIQAKGAVGDYSPAFIRVSLAAPIMPHVAGAALPVSYGTSLPGGPLDGQEAILVDSLTNPQYQWRFRYNAGSSSSYKWEFVGGTSREVRIPTMQQLTVSGSWQDLATVGPSFVVPRAGDYTVQAGANIYNVEAGPAPGFVGPAIGAGTPTNYAVTMGVATATNTVSTPIDRMTGLAASAEIRVRYYSPSSIIQQFVERWLSVTPVRVS